MSSNRAFSILVSRFSGGQALIRQGILLLIRGYQKGVSPFLPPSCRFVPSCSEYMAEAIVRRGVGRGVLLGLARLLKCHPFHSGGYDPVP